MRLSGAALPVSSWHLNLDWRSFTCFLFPWVHCTVIAIQLSFISAKSRPVLAASCAGHCSIPYLSTRKTRPQFSQEGRDHHLQLFSIMSPNAAYTKAYIERDGYLVVYTNTSGLRFDKFRFQPGLWYHVALVHDKGSRTKSPAVSLHVNGLCVQVRQG